MLRIAGRTMRPETGLHPSRRRCAAPQDEVIERVTKLSRVFLVALEKLDRNPLRSAQETDAHAGANGGRLLCELDALGLDGGSDRVDVFHGEAEMIEPLIRRHRWGVDAVARC